MEQLEYYKELDRKRGIKYALEHKLNEGIEKGREEGREALEIRNIDIIQEMLNNSLDWSLIESITHINESAYQALLAKYSKA